MFLEATTDTALACFSCHVLSISTAKGAHLLAETVRRIRVVLAAYRISLRHSSSQQPRQHFA
jgi:hypothetical protein